jgi:hypothetical protein
LTAAGFQSPDPSRRQDYRVVVNPRRGHDLAEVVSTIAIPNCPGLSRYLRAQR